MPNCYMGGVGAKDDLCHENKIQQFWIRGARPPAGNGARPLHLHCIENLIKYESCVDNSMKVSALHV